MKKLLLTLLFLLSACSLGGGEIRPLRPPFMPAGPQGGPQEFQQGWKDGCDTGMAAHGTDVYRIAFGFIQNPDLALNPIYYKAWKDAENYCRTYIYEYSIRSMDIYCTLDGMVNECADTSKAAGPFMGQSPESFSIFGVQEGGGVGSVLGGASSDDAPFMGGGSNDGSFLGNW